MDGGGRRSPSADLGERKTVKILGARRCDDAYASNDVITGDLVPFYFILIFGFLKAKPCPRTSAANGTAQRSARQIKCAGAVQGAGEARGDRVNINLFLSIYGIFCSLGFLEFRARGGGLLAIAICNLEPAQMTKACDVIISCVV